MKTVLLFGAGKSATALIHYLLENAATEDWSLLLVDADISLAREKIGTSNYGTVDSFDIANNDLRKKAIAKADIVISLLPAHLHMLVAKDCIELKKNLLTASYVDAEMKNLITDIEKNNLLFLCEMGLDPGIDHMSAKKIIDAIHSEGGQVTSFKSHCGGLVAAVSDNNPWHYKISWNPRNVVTAGKAGAIFKEKGEIRELDYEELFAEKRYVLVPGHEVLCWYPNRDSLSYINKYGLEQTDTFIRTTLRHPDFIYGWKNIVDLKLTDEERIYESDNKTLARCFKEHMDRYDFGEWLTKKLHEQFDATKGLLSELVNLARLEEEAAEKGVAPVEEFMMVNEEGDLKKIDIDDLKITAATTLADKMHDANLTLKQLFFLGMSDEQTLVNKGKCSASDILQFALEKKLALQANDKDLVVMLHEIEYEKDGKKYKATSTLLQTGENSMNTAMARTVGLPLGVAAKLILRGDINITGLHVPLLPEIYKPVLKELERHEIVFNDTTEELTP